MLNLAFVSGGVNAFVSDIYLILTNLPSKELSKAVGLQHMAPEEGTKINTLPDENGSLLGTVNVAQHNNIQGSARLLMTTLCNLDDFHDSFQNSLNHRILLFNVSARGTCLRNRGKWF